LLYKAQPLIASCFAAAKALSGNKIAELTEGNFAILHRASKYIAIYKAIPPSCQTKTARQIVER
jgi:hypothetical protein